MPRRTSRPRRPSRRRRSRSRKFRGDGSQEAADALKKAFQTAQDAFLKQSKQAKQQTLQINTAGALIDKRIDPAAALIQPLDELERLKYTWDKRMKGASDYVAVHNDIFKRVQAMKKIKGLLEDASVEETPARREPIATQVGTRITELEQMKRF